MASITTIGVGSGLPLDNLLTQIEASERNNLVPITTKQKNNTAKISAYGSIKSSITELQKTVQALKQTKTFAPTTATTSGTGVSVAAGSGAVAGSYQVKVNTLAAAHNVATENFASKTDPISGSGKLTIGVAGKDVDIDIAEGSTLETIRNQINNSDAGVSATIINTGDSTNPYKLSISSKTTGTDNQVSVSFAGTGDLQTKLNDSAHGGTISEVQAAANAEIEVNGISITSQSNTLEEAIGGVTMTVNTAGSTQTVSVAKDTGAVKTSVQAFVDAYNAYIKTTQTTTSFNDDPTLSGKLLGDSTLRNIKSSISDVLNTAQTGEYQIMAQFGVKLNVDGTLAVDDEKLTKAIETNGDAVTEFFTGTDGFATRMDKKLTNILSTEGPLETATAGLTKANEALTEQADKMQESIQATVARYRTQFSSIDTLVSKNNSTISYLAEQFSIMAKNSSSD